MINELTRILMTEIGLDLNEDMDVVDQDNNSLIMYKNKTLKETYIENQEVFIGRNSMLFEPMTNFKLMANIFSYHINKMEQEEGRYFMVIYPVQSHDQTRTSLVIREGNTDIKSLYYMNPCLAYIDLIFRISGEYGEVDLTRFDQPIIFPQK